MALSGVWGGLGTSGRGRGSGVYVTFQNVELVQAIFREVEDGLRKEESGRLRQTAKAIAGEVVIPQLLRAARSSPVPIARAMAATARPKADRVVMVQIGGVNPALSGFRRGIGARRAGGRSTRTGRDASSRNYRTTLAWGSELGPYPGAKVNHYGVGRGSGYWVRPGTVNSIPAARARYEDALNDLIRRASRYR